MTWTRAAVQDELIKLFRAHANEDVEVTVASHLVADLSIDSLGVMEVLADIEDRFDLKIPDEALREVDTIGDVAKAIEVRLQGDGRLDG